MLSGEYPEGSLGEVAGRSADSDGMALALTHLVVDLADVLGLPGGVMAMADHHVGSFDEAHFRYWLQGLRM